VFQQWLCAGLFFFIISCFFQCFNLLSFVSYKTWSCSLLFHLQFYFSCLFCSFCFHICTGMLLIMDATLSICCCLLSNRSVDVSTTSEKIKLFLQLLWMPTSDPANQELCSDYGQEAGHLKIFSALQPLSTLFFLFQVVWSDKYNLMNLFGSRVSRVWTYEILLASDQQPMKLC